MSYRSTPPAGLTATKRCVQYGLQSGQQAGEILEDELRIQVSLTSDAIEGRAAFLEKREPRFPSVTGDPPAHYDV